MSTKTWIFLVGDTGTHTSDPSSPLGVFRCVLRLAARECCSGSSVLIGMSIAGRKSGPSWGFLPSLVVADATAGYSFLNIPSPLLLSQHYISSQRSSTNLLLYKHLFKTRLNQYIEYRNFNLPRICKIKSNVHKH